MTPTDREVATRPLDDEPFLLQVDALAPGLALDAWIGRHHGWVTDKLTANGALLFRGFAVVEPAEFRRAAAAVSPNLLGYLERAAPRTEVMDNVFTSTEFASDEWIPFHHEMSYAHNWPSRLYLYCDQAPVRGGATPVASERTVYLRIPAEIRERFERGGVRYVRNYGPYVDLPWQEAFQTTDRAQVEAYCRNAGMDCTWTPEDGLRTVAVRQATSRHPDTGEVVWFNHAHIFHLSSLSAEVSAMLVEELGTDGLPRNAYYGDGTPIEDEVVSLIHDRYREAAVSFRWQRGDVLVVDNILSAHAREPFSGARRILVAMSDLHVSGFSRDVATA